MSSALELCGAPVASRVFRITLNQPTHPCSSVSSEWGFDFVSDTRDGVVAVEGESRSKGSTRMERPEMPQSPSPRRCNFKGQKETAPKLQHGPSGLCSSVRLLGETW